MFKEIEQKVLCKDFAKGVRFYFPMKSKVEVEAKVNDLCKKISSHNHVAEITIESNEKLKQRRVTLSFLNPVPITSEEIFDDLLECYFELFQDEANIVMVSAMDGSESEYALWDLKNCSCQ